MSDLIHRSDVEKMLRDMIDYRCDGGIQWTEDEVGTLQYALEKLSSIQSVDEWISVEDRLPEKDWDYLTANKDELEINWYCSKRERFWRTEIIITHWKHLPPSPTSNDK